MSYYLTQRENAFRPVRRRRGGVETGDETREDDRAGGEWALLKIEGFDARGLPFGTLFFHVSPSGLRASVLIFDDRHDPMLSAALETSVGKHLAAVYLDRHQIARLMLALESHQAATLHYQTDRPDQPAQSVDRLDAGAVGCGAPTMAATEPPVTMVVELAFDRQTDKKLVVPSVGFVDRLVDMEEKGFAVEQWRAGVEFGEQMGGGRMCWCRTARRCAPTADGCGKRRAASMGFRVRASTSCR